MIPLDDPPKANVCLNRTPHSFGFPGKKRPQMEPPFACGVPSGPQTLNEGTLGKWVYHLFGVAPFRVALKGKPKGRRPFFQTPKMFFVLTHTTFKRANTCCGGGNGHRDSGQRLLLGKTPPCCLPHGSGSSFTRAGIAKDSLGLLAEMEIGDTTFLEFLNPNGYPNPLEF